MDQFVVSTLDQLIPSYGQEGDHNRFHGSTIFNDAAIIVIWDENQVSLGVGENSGQNLLWRVALGLILHRNQAHSQWQCCLYCWCLSCRLYWETSISEFFQALVLIIKMPMLSMPLRKICTWYEPSCYMFHFIGLNMVLMIWYCGHLLSSMLPGCRIWYLAEQQDSLQLNCSPRLMLIIEIFSQHISGMSFIHYGP